MPDAPSQGASGSRCPPSSVVSLQSPILEGGNLTFEVAVLEGSLSGSSGPAALIIDRGGGGGGFGGAPVHHGAGTLVHQRWQWAPQQDGLPHVHTTQPLPSRSVRLLPVAALLSKVARSLPLLYG